MGHRETPSISLQSPRRHCRRIPNAYHVPVLHDFHPFGARTLVWNWGISARIVHRWCRGFRYFAAHLGAPGNNNNTRWLLSTGLGGRLSLSSPAIVLRSHLYRHLHQAARGCAPSEQTRASKKNNEVEVQVHTQYLHPRGDFLPKHPNSTRTARYHTLRSVRTAACTGLVRCARQSRTHVLPKNTTTYLLTSKLSTISIVLSLFVLFSILYTHTHIHKHTSKFEFSLYHVHTHWYVRSRRWSQIVNTLYRSLSLFVLFSILYTHTHIHKHTSKFEFSLYHVWILPLRGRCVRRTHTRRRCSRSYCASCDGSATAGSLRFLCTLAGTKLIFCASALSGQDCGCCFFLATLTTANGICTASCFSVLATISTVSKGRGALDGSRFLFLCLVVGIVELEHEGFPPRLTPVSTPCPCSGRHASGPEDAGSVVGASMSPAAAGN